MTLNYLENTYEAAASFVKTTEITSDQYRENTDSSKPINRFLLQPSHELTSSKSYSYQNPSMKTKNHFNPTQLKNPDPSNAFFFVIMISIGTILLPFIPVAANYLSKVIEPCENNNYHNQLIHQLISRR
jgi:hypothetical protein